MFVDWVLVISVLLALMFWTIGMYVVYIMLVATGSMERFTNWYIEKTSK